VTQTVTPGGGTIRIKLSDKQAALEKLGKALRPFGDRVEITGRDGGPIEMTEVDPHDEIRRRITEWGQDGVKVKDSASLTEDQESVVAEVTQTVAPGGGTVRIKLSDKQAALEKLGKALRLFGDRVEITGPDGGRSRLIWILTMKSDAELLSLLPASEREKILRTLSREQAASLRWNWKFWARPDQVPPPGNWVTWLILAGRGWGKTRTAAEWVRQKVCGKTPLAGGQSRRIALVAETAADARDVLVEGETGLLSVHPRDFRPTYEPSKRRLTCPNGAVATLFNAAARPLSLTSRKLPGRNRVSH